MPVGTTNTMTTTTPSSYKGTVRRTDADFLISSMVAFVLTISVVSVMLHVLHMFSWFMLLPITLLIVLRAVSHEASLHKDSEDEVDMQGDVPMMMMPVAVT